MLKSINPSNNQVIKEYPVYTSFQVNEIIGKVNDSFQGWSRTAMEQRSLLMKNLGALLRQEVGRCAELMANEMGKPIAQGRYETLKSASACEFYADHAREFLQDEAIPTGSDKSFVAFQPLGIILGIMPWNFPFWQVFRFAVPAIMAGNAALLKHAANVSGCALLIEELFRAAGFPHDLFRTLLLPADQVEMVIADPRVKAVTLTGSERAGEAVAAAAGRALKKAVLELGGSDPYIVLDDADLNKSVEVALRARLNNCGQSCIAAKRFLIHHNLYHSFCDKLIEKLSTIKIGDPLKEETEMGPLARKDLLENMERQIAESIRLGAKLRYGGKRVERQGFFFTPTVLTNVQKGMPAFDEETFGPLFALIEVKDEREAIAMANDSIYGLGASVWTEDRKRGERIARELEVGSVYINSQMVSNVQLPFGGVKKSGYGRELSHFGIKEFVNIKTIYVV